jgi:hypothetical protein
MRIIIYDNGKIMIFTKERLGSTMKSSIERRINEWLDSGEPYMEVVQAEDGIVNDIEFREWPG